MNDELFQQIKEILNAHGHLFAKLHKVGREYETIDFDESGLYEEDVERTLRHWGKLTAKLASALQEGLDESTVRTEKNSDPGSYTAVFVISREGSVPFRLDIDYAQEGQISITRIS